MKRLVPSILIDEGGAWATKNFKKHVYLGEPSNAVRIFNELMADELSVNWVGRDKCARDRALNLISSQASMPLSYTGGVSSKQDALEIVRMGFERVGVTSSALKGTKLLKEISDEIGRSSLLVKIPTIIQNSEIKVWDWKASRQLDIDLVSLIQELDEIRVGEICVTSVNNNGRKIGIDFHAAQMLLKYTNNSQRGYEGGISTLSDVEKAWSIGADVVYSCTMLTLFGEFDAPLFDYPIFFEDRYKN